MSARDALGTIERDGCTVSLFVDDDASSPDGWDNLATFEHVSGYTFGDSTGEPERGWAVYARWLTLFGGAAAVLPVRLEDYGSGGLRVHETDGENANGVLFTTDARVTELCGDGATYHEQAWILDALRDELRVWAQYLEGDVYGYSVEDSRGETVDSLWGLYGWEYAREEAARALADAVETDNLRRSDLRPWVAA